MRGTLFSLAGKQSGKCVDRISYKYRCLFVYVRFIKMWVECVESVHFQIIP